MESIVTRDVIEHYKKRLVSPWKLYDKSLDQYKVVDGYLMHIKAHTRIGGMKTQGNVHNDFVNILLNNLKLWHEFANEHGIIYTLIASNLISYYCSESLLPWEDDIDVTIRHKDWVKLVTMYDNLPSATDVPQALCHAFTPKRIPNTELYLCRSKFPGKMKIVNQGRLSFFDKYQSPSGMRGIDICCSIPYGGSYIESFWAYRGFFPVCPGPGDWMCETECPEVKYSGIITRAIQPDFAFPYLIHRYGTKWDAMIQPRLIDKSNGHIPCKLQHRKDNPHIISLIEEWCK